MNVHDLKANYYVLKSKHKKNVNNPNFCQKETKHSSNTRTLNIMSAGSLYWSKWYIWLLYNGPWWSNASDFCMKCIKPSVSPLISGLKFHQEAKSWIDALEHCHNEYSSLVQITNATEQEAVNCLLQSKINSAKEGVWIGLERFISDRRFTWAWTSGEKFEGNAQWSGSFPVDQLNNHCGKIIWVNEKFKWLDARCHDKLPFICQGKLLCLRPNLAWDCYQM